MARFSVALAGLLSVSLLSGCRERNPAYVDRVEGSDAPPAQTDVKVEANGEDASPADVPDASADLRIADEPIMDAPESGGDLTVNGEVSPLVDDARPERPARPETGDPFDAGADGEREVGERPDVARERGGDGRGDGGRDPNDGPSIADDGGADVGVEVGEDAADVPPVCPEPALRSCESPGNPLIGACKAGKQTCSNGEWEPLCKDEVLPAAGEACNGIDDDCDGLTDEGCVEGCVVVAPDGDDETADGTSEKPFATITKALAFAVAADGGAPRSVCVAGGATCDAVPEVYEMDASLSIPGGARVHGNYALAGEVLSYCADTQPPTTTLRLKSAGASVVFSEPGTSQTELGGFSIERPSLAISAGEAITAVLVAGAQNVMLSGIFVTDAPAGDTTYGVLVKGGGHAAIVGSAIFGGLGKVAAIGVYVDGGSVYLRDNCDSDHLSGDSCQSRCDDQETVLGIRGRSVGGAAEGDSSAVYVTEKSTAPSTIVASLLCGGPGEGTTDSRGANVAALRCAGNGCDVIEGNAIEGGSGKLPVAVAFLGCGGRLQANAIAAGCGSQDTTGVLLNASPARLYNNRVLGSECIATTDTPDVFYGLRVVHTSGNAEPLIHSNDIDPRGHGGECESRGVYFERVSGQAASNGIVRNNIVAAGSCKIRTAVYEDQGASSRVLENNDLYPGPSSPAGAATVLLRRGGNDALTIDKVNGLPGAAGNVSADPSFVSYPDDLRLTEESKQCVDKGTAAGAPQTDADGIARPQGSGFDIGAYELVRL